MVQIFFQLMKDEIIELVMGRKQSIVLSFYIGKLSVNSQGVVHFQSNTVGDVLKH